MPPAKLVVVVTYEFTFAPFSGNGMLARALVRALLELGCNIAVVCARPHSKDLSHLNHIEQSELDHASIQQLSLLPVHLPENSTWRRLDQQSAWETFAQGAANLTMDAFSTQPDAVLAVDWTGAAAWRKMRQVVSSSRLGSHKFCYLNFRVYSAGLPASDGQWYDEKESEAVADADVIISLSRVDEISLRKLAKGRAVDIHLLLPPLRHAIHKLAERDAADFLDYFPYKPAVSEMKKSGQPSRKYLCCVVRLSREKETHRFVDLVRCLGTRLSELNVTPLLCGAASDSTYADNVKRQLLQVEPNSVVIEDFLDPTALASVFSQSIMNFHPCRYEAYGMTIIEAAAFGTPSFFNAIGIGASELLCAGRGTAFQANFDRPIAEIADQVASLLEDTQALNGCGERARQRALEWNELAYGRRLSSYLALRF